MQSVARVKTGTFETTFSHVERRPNKIIFGPGSSPGPTPQRRLIRTRLRITRSREEVRSTSTPVYLHRRIAECACSRTLCSAAIPLLDKRFMRTDFSKRDFRSSEVQHRLSGTRCHKQFSSVILWLFLNLGLITCAP